VRDLASLDGAIGLGARLSHGGALLRRLGAIVVRGCVDCQRDEIVTVVGGELVVRTSHDRSLPRFDSIGRRGLEIERFAMSALPLRRHLDEY
jgi:hypothetical protein